MGLHSEIHLEDEVSEYLHDHGWLYRKGDAADYDRLLALYPADVLAWVQDAHKKAWETLTKAHGDNAGTVLVNRLRGCIRAEGTLHALRHGIDVFGLKGKLEMAQFRPALAMNPELMARYKANRLRVVRQVNYSLVNENCIDLVLFLNGIPVATVELKSDFTQSVQDAVQQYKYDREPKPKGSSSEDRNPPTCFSPIVGKGNASSLTGVGYWVSPPRREVTYKSQVTSHSIGELRSTLAKASVGNSGLVCVREAREHNLKNVDLSNWELNPRKVSRAVRS